jgi:hypothetical protein
LIFDGQFGWNCNVSVQRDEWIVCDRLRFPAITE